MSFKDFILLLPIFYITDCGLFELTHHYYCKKNKGCCENCKDWSCFRYQYLNKE